MWLLPMVSAHICFLMVFGVLDPAAFGMLKVEAQSIPSHVPIRNLLYRRAALLSPGSSNVASPPSLHDSLSVHRSPSSRSYHRAGSSSDPAAAHISDAPPPAQPPAPSTPQTQSARTQGHARSAPPAMS